MYAQLVSQCVQCFYHSTVLWLCQPGRASLCFRAHYMASPLAKIQKTRECVHQHTWCVGATSAKAPPQHHTRDTNMCDPCRGCTCWCFFLTLPCLCPQGRIFLVYASRCEEGSCQPAHPSRMPAQHRCSTQTQAGRHWRLVVNHQSAWAIVQLHEKQLAVQLQSWCMCACMFGASHRQVLAAAAHNLALQRRPVACGLPLTIVPPR